ncbi:lipid-binding SYLF domain-containing protein [Ruegeria aquimaris]|uniref:Ysc84 actin-binding domain-containing protein n=1 Tax=Ruegeria aquimaris TaxID=2984333 RepID=A0ABT3ANH7_9RHOB|nr:hypothetical protein [Ruegeria sp. XHP0148]MCV2890238.1 hypothetical protein [Ruegeria sp. XHP0148]
MLKTVFVFCLAVWICGPVAAESLLGKLKQGAESAGDAIGRGAEKVGETLETGAEAVGESINSTVELVSNEDTPEETRAKLDAMANEVLDRLLRENDQAATLYAESAGYAAFDTRKVTVFPVAAGYGRGVAVSNADGQRVYMNLGTGGLGAAMGIGGFATQFVILFETAGDFEEFVTNGYDATGETSAMYGDEKAEQTVQFKDGRSIFVLGKTGWRVAASASGTKYWKAPDLN